MAHVPGFQPPTNAVAPPEPETLAAITRGGASDAALMEVSIRIARQYPRDERKIVEKLRSTLELYPQFAEKALYSIPYKDNRSGRPVKVEGLTIRAAETLKSAWGNMRSGVRIIGEDDGGVDLEAVAFDMETNVWELVPGRAIKILKTREGRLVTLDERTFLQARGAAASKANRNAILSVLPLHIKAFFETMVRRHMAGGELNKPAAKDRIERAVTWYATTYQVTVEQLETYVGKPTALWVGEDIADLQGLKNALEQGEATVAEVFAVDKPEAPARPAPVVLDVQEGQLRAPDARPPEPEPEPKPTPRPMPPKPPRPRAKATPYVEPTPAPVDNPQYNLDATARRLGIDPTPVDMPAPSKTVVVDTQGEEEMSLRLRLSTEIAAASTVAECDAILGRIYADKTVPRGVKRDALDWVTERRDALQAQSQQ